MIGLVQMDALAEGSMGVLRRYPHAAGDDELRLVPRQAYRIGPSRTCHVEVPGMVGEWTAVAGAGRVALRSAAAR